jgi:ketosteroid isomerase-like protein
MVEGQHWCEDLGMVRSTEAELEELFDRYNRCFYDRDLNALRSLYVDDDAGFVYFDNHADSDSVGLDDHLSKVSAFFASGAVVSLATEVLATSVHGDAGCLVARVRYQGSSGPSVRTSMFAERHAGEWRVRHLHFSSDPNDTDAAAAVSTASSV